MNPKEYQERAMKLEADQMGLASMRQNMILADRIALVEFDNGLTGLMDEVGELSSLKKKWLEYQQKAPNPEDILEECGDVLWRTCQILKAFGLTLEQAMHANLGKLENVRYKGTVCNPFDAAEENRDRDKEKEEVRSWGELGEVSHKKAVEKLKDWAKRKQTYPDDNVLDKVDNSSIHSPIDTPRTKAQLGFDDGVNYEE